MNSNRSTSQTLQYQRFITSGYKDKAIRKLTSSFINVCDGELGMANTITTSSNSAILLAEKSYERNMEKHVIGYINNDGERY